MNILVKSVGKAWKATPTSDPLWTIIIDGQTEPCKTYDPALAAEGWHEAETFISKSGKEYWRTPKEPKVLTAKGGEQTKYQPKDEAAIKAMWDIGQAVQLAITNGGTALTSASIEVQADKLFAMVDRVKEGTPEVSKMDRGDFASVELPPVEVYDE